MILFTGTYNQNIHVYDINTHQHIKALTGHFGTVTGLVLSVTGRLLFSASYDTTVQVGYVLVKYQGGRERAGKRAYIP
jgi:E3 ubiquitin-protein ligase TRAF7